MEKYNDDVLLIDSVDQKRSFLHKKISVTIPICILLIVVFFTSIFLVSIFSWYWIDDTKCYINTNEIIKPDEPKPRQVYYSRPKRSPTMRKTARVPCFGFECCTTSLNPAAPWNQSRLPTNLYPIDYQVTLDLSQLNEGNDVYSGTVDIVLEIDAPTYDIILHGTITLTDITVSQRSSPSNIPLDVDCTIPFPDTQTLTIHLKQRLEVGSVYDVRMSFSRVLNIHGTGVFQIQFSKDLYGMEISRMLLTHLKPVHAREAFPCFDEPDYKTKFQLSVIHENDTTVLSNWDVQDSYFDENAFVTDFETTPPIPPSLMAFAIFFTDDFDKQTVTVTHPVTNRDIMITLWARKKYFTNDNGMHITSPLLMAKDILTALLTIFKDVTTPIVARQINILAVPEYPSDAVSHWGFIVCHERAILHNPETASAADHQKIVLILAKQLAEQWFGNFISTRWWTEVWLQEALSNYLAYHAVNMAYPQWNVTDQFISGELLPTMYDDALSSAHPVQKSVNSPTEIDELFDSIETTKATALLKMADYYMEESTGVVANTLNHVVSLVRNNEYGYIIPDELINTYRIGPWQGFDFFDRWLLQSNYPKVFVHFIWNETMNSYILEFMQSRYLTAHMYEYDLYPPETTPFGYIWYIPITCRFSNDTSYFQSVRTFYLDSGTVRINFGNLYYRYYYCNADFAGYYIMDYTSANWEALDEALDNNNAELTALDRANLLNNAFLSAQAVEESYGVVRSATQFLFRSIYTEVLPWQILSYHVNRMLDVLEYESLFYYVQRYFQIVVRNYYRTYESTLWNATGTFPEQLLKGVIIQLACRVRLYECVHTALLSWDDAYLALANGQANHSVAPHARSTVYRIHFQNTYNDSEWITIQSEYYYLVDVQERHRLLEGLTQTRQPWHLYQFLYQDAEGNSDFDIDLLDVLTLYSRNPAGRELAWYYYRENWAQLQSDYESTNQRLGQLLIDITATFEDEFHDYELNQFLATTPGVDTNVDARFWAIERANLNFWWVVDSYYDIEESFNIEEKHN